MVFLGFSGFFKEQYLKFKKCVLHQKFALKNFFANPVFMKDKEALSYVVMVLHKKYNEMDNRIFDIPLQPMVERKISK